MARRPGPTPRLLRFLVVGGVNTLFGYGAYALLLFVGLSYGWAALFGTVAGIAFNYLTTGRFVFGDRAGIPWRFVAIYVLTYLLNLAALWMLDRAGWDPYRSGLVLIVPMALVSFALMRTFVFRNTRVAD